MTSFGHIAELSGATWLNRACEAQAVETLITDSRKASEPLATAVFFAVSGINHDGHAYVPYLYERGVRMFIVSREIAVPGPDAGVLLTDNTIKTLQQVATAHRRNFTLTVIGITGSNGKTIVKEWLSQLLSPYRRIVKSPGSYNSQIGVPLSIWQTEAEHDLGIFEAGISQVGEMDAIEEIIKPDIGIFTNIGSAHDEGFSSRQQKIQEKLKLFRNCKTLIYRRDHELIHNEVKTRAFHWGNHAESLLHIEKEERQGTVTRLYIRYDGYTSVIRLPFTDAASLENAMHCIAYMVFSGFTWKEIEEGLQQLHPMRMRLELKRGGNGSYIIDDSYNNDLAGLQIALDFLTSQPGAGKKTLIVSDILQAGISADNWVSKIKEMAQAAGIKRLITVGPEWFARSDNTITSYRQTSDLLDALDTLDFDHEFILVKGARPFQLEKVVRRLEEKIHGTVLEVNLNALTSNLNFYRSRLQKNVRLMVMVKAFAYGSGSVEIANLLAYHRVDYLGVAYADEGVHLRNNGIRLPVMVMNPSSDSMETMLAHNLEPEIYNFRLLEDLIHISRGRPCRIHLKFDTGMHRLGFVEEEINRLAETLAENSHITVASIFSHLAGADDSRHDSFSREQIERFKNMSSRFSDLISSQPLKHILNSPGILRFPDYQFDMVRLGIGLYGVEANDMEQERLEPISRLLTVISQVKNINKGDTIGYNRKGVAKADMRIATIAIGYADGFSRAFSNGIGYVWINGKKAPVIGNVCMDMTMVDISGIDAHEGDIVEVFGPNISIRDMAAQINTIPYEILTNVSQRVRRVFYTE
jgi:alanine racemase